MVVWELNGIFQGVMLGIGSDMARMSTQKHWLHCYDLSFQDCLKKAHRAGG